MAKHYECDTGDERDDQSESHRENEVKASIIINEDDPCVAISQLCGQCVYKSKSEIWYHEEQDSDDVEKNEVDSETAKLIVIDHVEEAIEETKYIPRNVKARGSHLSSIKEALEQRECHEDRRHTEIEDSKTARWVVHSLMLLL